MFAQVKNCKRSSQRLLNALHELKLTVPMIVLIGQLRNSCIYQTDISHLKLLGSFFDQCQETLFQYQEFLGINIPHETLASILPSIPDFCSKYFIGSEATMHVSRYRFARLDAETATSEIKEALPESTWKGVSPEFAMIFWKLTMADIYVPEERYKAEIAKLQASIAAYNEKPASSYQDSASLAKRKKEKDKATLLLAKLEKELL